MEPLKLGLIGFGKMGKNHLRTLIKIPESVVVTAICDCDLDLSDIPEAKDIPVFTDYNELINSGLCEAIGVSTPHPCHAEISIAAMQKGLDVMCEKPVSERVSKADALLASAQSTGRVLCTNFAMRTYAINQIVRDWIQSGKLGRILRADFVCTNWIRAQCYYDKQNWRGRWLGEGGGVLMNQAPHNLDLLYYWFGEMESVRGTIGVRHHDIETEDEVEATFITRAGFPVRFYATTGEAPGVDRIEIFGENGTLVRELGKLTFRKPDKTVPEMIGGDIQFPTYQTEEIEVPIPTQPEGREVVWKNFAKVIREGGELVAPGTEAIHAVEFANAITLSHFEKRPIAFPVDRAAYDALLDSLIRKERSL